MAKKKTVRQAIECALADVASATKDRVFSSRIHIERDGETRACVATDGYRLIIVTSADASPEARYDVAADAARRAGIEGVRPSEFRDLFPHWRGVVDACAPEAPCCAPPHAFLVGVEALARGVHVREVRKQADVREARKRDKSISWIPDYGVGLTLSVDASRANVCITAEHETGAIECRQNAIPLREGRGACHVNVSYLAHAVRTLVEAQCPRIELSGGGAFDPVSLRGEAPSGEVIRFIIMPIRV